MHNTGDSVMDSTRAPARENAYVCAMGRKSCPSAPDMANSGTKAHTMIRMENSSAWSISCTKSLIRSLRGRSGWLPEARLR